MTAILEFTKKYYLLEQNEIATITKDDVKICDVHKEPVKKEIQVADWDADAAQKGGYEHFMLKEIHEQPTAIKTTITPRINEGMVDFPNVVLLMRYLRDMTISLLLPAVPQCMPEWWEIYN